MVNQQQREQWNAPNQARVWPRRERITACVTAPLLAALALQPGERVLDVGSGGGLAAMEAAKAVAPGGQAVGFDLSAPLVELAKDRAREEGVDNVEFFAGDAQTDDIPGAPFNAAMSQFGVMFFADPMTAFANMRRHMRPGGRMTFACWQPAAKNAWFPMATLARYLPPPPPNLSGTPPPGPLAFGDPAYVAEILGGAGFEAIERQEFHHTASVPEDSVFERETLDTMPIDDEMKESAWRDLQGLAASLRGPDGELRLHLAAHFFTAWNPV